MSTAARKHVVGAIDRLTVPGVGEALRRARGLVTCHSSLNILAWRMRQPQVLLYPPAVQQVHFCRVNEWSFGQNYPETRHGLFDDPRVPRWLEDLFGCGR